MTRFCTILILASSFLFCSEAVYSQTVVLNTPPKNGPKLFTPLKSFRERAANGVLADAKKALCAKCLLGGKLCPACKCKKKEREEKKAAEEEKAQRAEEAALKKIEAEAKKAELEAQLLEEEEAKRNKPWEVQDKENLESPSELLKLAAESKRDQELAPKKQKALDYLASLGCNKDPKVSQAILKGLKDFNVDVRMVSVQTVLAVVRGPLVVEPEQYNPELTNLHQPVEIVMGDEVPVYCACGQPCCQKCEEKEKEPKDPCEVAKERKEKRAHRHEKLKIKNICSRCKGKGCRSCNNRGRVVEAYSQICPACCPEMAECSTCGPMVAGGGGCQSCCSIEIIKELTKMATLMDPEREGCFYEPSPEVRALAQEALDLCPKQKDVTPITPPVIEKNKDKKDQGGVIEGNSGGGNRVPTPADDNTDSTTIQNSESAFQPASHRSSSERLLDARITQFYNKGYMIEFDGEYLIPEGHLLYVTVQDGSSQVVEVLDSEVGFARVTPIEGSLKKQRDSRIYVGIVE